MTIDERLKTEQILLGQRITQLMEAQQLTQKKLAEKSGLEVRTIRRIEKGEANSEFRTLVKLSDGLKVPIAAIFDYAGEINLTSLIENLNSDERLLQETKKVGQRILALCKHRGIDQEELGVLSNIANSDISLYINGQENLVLLTLLKISIALEVAITELFNYDGALPDNKTFKGKIQF